jgi:hypothetical protein
MKSTNKPDTSANGHGEPIEEGDRSKASALRENGHGESESAEDIDAGGNGHGEGDHPAPSTD